MEVSTILTLLVLNILLPTLDTFTDINLVAKLYHGSHPVFASVLLVPFLLNYLACWYTFFEEERSKKYTFIFPLLNLYPQFGINHHFIGNIVVSLVNSNEYFRGFENSLRSL